MKTIITTPNRFIAYQVYEYIRSVGSPTTIVRIDDINVVIEADMFTFLVKDFNDTGFEMGLYKEEQCIIKIIC